jgi:hypothetical protein
LTFYGAEAQKAREGRGILSEKTPHWSTPKTAATTNTAAPIAAATQRAPVVVVNAST